MVSPQNIPTSVASTSGIPVFDRGMVREELVIHEVQPGLTAGRPALSWSAPIGGTLLTVALLILATAGAKALDIPAFNGGVYGWGAGIWSFLAAIVAFTAGGWFTACLMPRTDARYTTLGGLLTWALVVPVSLLLGIHMLGGMMPAHMIWADSSAPLLQGNALPTLPTWDTPGAHWGTMLALAVGLPFAIIGGLVGAYLNVTTLPVPPETLPTPRRRT